MPWIIGCVTDGGGSAEKYAAAPVGGAPAPAGLFSTAEKVKVCLMLAVAGHLGMIEIAVGRPSTAGEPGGSAGVKAKLWPTSNTVGSTKNESSEFPLRVFPEPTVTLLIIPVPSVYPILMP
jgi:hypothetical protein